MEPALPPIESLGPLQRELLDAAQVEFAGAEQGDLGHFYKTVLRGDPEVGEVALGQFVDDLRDRFRQRAVQDDQAFALLGVGDRGDGGLNARVGVSRIVDDLQQALFDPQMRHHLTADL